MGQGAHPAGVVHAVANQETPRSFPGDVVGLHGARGRPGLTGEDGGRHASRAGLPQVAVSLDKG